MIYLRLEENSPLGFHHPIFVCFIHFSPPLYRVYKKPSCFFPFSFLQICFNSFLSLSYQLRFVWKISAIKMWLLIIMVQNNGSSEAAIVIHSENTNLRSKGSSRLHVGMLFSVCFQFVHGREKRTSAKKLPHFLGELSHCHFVTNYFDFWGRRLEHIFPVLLCLSRTYFFTTFLSCFSHKWLPKRH